MNRNLKNICNCGHTKAQHIYAEGACRPGSVCSCPRFDTTDCHNLKIMPVYFRAQKCGDKTFERRKADRDYQVGDWLRLEEYDPNQGYSGEWLLRRVTYIEVGGSYGLAEDYVILGTQP